MTIASMLQRARRHGLCSRLAQQTCQARQWAARATTKLDRQGLRWGVVMSKF